MHLFFILKVPVDYISTDVNTDSPFPTKRLYNLCISYNLRVPIQIFEWFRIGLAPVERKKMLWNKKMQHSKWRHFHHLFVLKGCVSTSLNEAQTFSLIKTETIHNNVVPNHAMTSEENLSVWRLRNRKPFFIVLESSLEKGKKITIVCYKVEGFISAFL